MRSIHRTRRKHKRLGKARAETLEAFDEFEVDTKVELIRALIPLGLMAVQDTLLAEVTELAGERYSRGGAYRRHGSNPSTVELQGQRHAVRVPRVRDREGKEQALASWAALKAGGEPDELLLRRVLWGLSCRNYAAAAEALPGSIGLSAACPSRILTPPSVNNNDAVHGPPETR